MRACNTPGSLFVRLQSLFKQMLHLVRVIPTPIRYSVYMARGWESKSVEEQLEQRAEQREQAAKVASKDVMQATDAEQARARQMLRLKRERILSEKTSHPVRRSALQAALKDIEAELQKLG
jgi:hypothetical protein